VPTAPLDAILNALITTGEQIPDTRVGGSITKPRIQVNVAMQAFSRQTWDFGSGNGNDNAYYIWDLRSIDDPSLEPECWIGRIKTPPPFQSCLGQRGLFRVPKGHKFCAVTIDMQSTNIPVPSSLNGALYNQGHDFAWYGEFGTRAAPLSARVYFLIVPEAFGGGCMIDKAVFLCGVGAGNRQGCNEIQPGGVKRW
jgi:hypothetical protein